MALSLSQTDAVIKHAKRGMKVASMGYPDIIAPVEMLEQVMDVKDLKFRDDSLAICARHGLPNRKIPDAESFFSILGCELDVYDIVQERGCEIVRDLNYPLIEEIYPGEGTTSWKRYDMVLDVGTLEHCFNIAQAAFNMAELVALNGLIIHENPFNWGNHGLYNMNPTWYADFYAANGFKLLECRLASRDGGGAVCPHTKRFKWEGAEMNVFAVARRMDIKPMTFPVQSKYAPPVAVAQPGVKEGTNG